MSAKQPMRMSEMVVVRVVSKAFIPFILLFALYVQFHGDFGPGGGFQAGVIFGAGLILYGLVFGLEDLKRVAPAWAIESTLALGVLLYGGVGVAGLVLGGQFLEYNVLDAHYHLQMASGALAQTSLHPPNGHGQHLGLLLIEAGVGIAVSSAMTLIFYAFAGRKRVAS
jgi:multicomponent Na+:H+ antiporter subunit B